MTAVNYCFRLIFDSTHQNWMNEVLEVLRKTPEMEYYALLNNQQLYMSCWVLGGKIMVVSRLYMCIII